MGVYGERELEQVRPCTSHPKLDDKEVAGEDEKQHSMTIMSEVLKRDGIFESELLYINYAREIFEKYDRDGDKVASIGEIREVLTDFNIYFPLNKVATIVGMFLRNIGQPSE